MLAGVTCAQPGPGNVLDEEIVLSFVRSAIKSAWSLELLLLLYREPRQSWTGEALVRELRGSEHLVNESIETLAAAGLIEHGEAGARYRPQSSELEALATALIELYRQKPATVLRTIFASPSDKIRSFSDAFLFQKK
jgi:hypothetical protein